MKDFPSRRLGTALAALALAGSAPSAWANMVSNGSFELTTASTTSFFNSVTVNNWSNSDIGEALVMPSWYTNGYLFPGVGVAGPLPQTSPDGGNFVFSDGNYHNSPIQQTITGLSPGGVYQLSFWQALAQDTEINVTIPGPVTGYWQVSLGSFTLNSSFMSGNGATLTISPWQQQTMVFKATSSTEVLSFLSVGTGDPPLVFLDGISLAPVPEPETLALMGVGGLVLMLRLRRERRRQQA